MKTLVLSTAFVLAPLAYAQAATVYPGCAVPAIKPGHKTFYVDPARGSMSGDGSAGKPWHTLAEVLASSKLVAKPSSPGNPVKSGDVIMLKSGNHGDVRMTGFMNSEFITVMPAPGQAPIVQSLMITSGSKWLFQGLKFTTGVSTKRPGGIVAVGYGDWQGTTKDIVIDNNTVSTVDDTSSWSKADWRTHVQSTGVWTRQVSCVAVTNNHIMNVLNGVAMTASNSLVQGNLIEHTFNDGIDVTNSDILVKNNIIRGGTNNSADEYHADGIQGWSQRINGVPQLNKNVTIDGNTIIKFGDPTVSYMQGISIFDGLWDNLVIQNNVVAVNHWNAMTLMGPKNSKILNNTVIATSQKHPSWIMVRNGKAGGVSDNVLVRNNIATQISVVGTNMKVDHNIAITSMGIPGNKSIRSGSIGVQNRVVPSMANQFAAFNTAAQQADLRLKRSSPAVAAGVDQDAPPRDIVGVTRKSPVDLGAYVH